MLIYLYYKSLVKRNFFSYKNLKIFEFEEIYYFINKIIYKINKKNRKSWFIFIIHLDKRFI